MSERNREQEQNLAALFDGLSRRERMALLSRLEYAGAALYRGFAAEEKNLKAREALLKAAEREEANGGVLRLMTTPKDRCEKCSAAMASVAVGYACSLSMLLLRQLRDRLQLRLPELRRRARKIRPRLKCLSPARHLTI